MKAAKSSRYVFPLAAMAAAGLFAVLFPGMGGTSLRVIVFSLKEMLLGLLDVWVPRETMMRFMGKGSGLKGVLLAVFLGSAAAGPLYAAFPVAAVFMRKGVKLANVFVFLGAWSTTKIPMLLFELSALGPRFALTRLAVDIPGIVAIAFALVLLLGKEEVEGLYGRAERLDA